MTGQARPGSGRAPEVRGFMQAVRMYTTGGPEVLQYEEAPAPEPGRNELLIRLRATAVNRTDLLLREGKLPLGKGMPLIPGTDGAGVVVRGTGGDARSGDRVLVCGDTLGRLRDGTYAEYVTVPSSMALPVPREMSYEEAAALGTSALTAWQALVDRAGIQPGQWVLVHAAGSGVGVAAIQIAKLLGARVIVTAGSSAKLDLARQLGADHGINYTRGDFASQARTLTGNRGVDVVLDTVGGEIFQRSLGCLCLGGRLIAVGSVGGTEVAVDLRQITFKGLSVIGLNSGALPPYQIADRFRQIVDLVARGRLRPVIDRVFPLDEAQAAHRLLAGRTCFGKIILRT